MSYFEQIDDYQTYRGDEYDFHLDYNANSGGGQAFLGGSFSEGDGAKHSSRELDGTTASFALRYLDAMGDPHVIELGVEEAYRYPITPRGAGSQQMKLGLGGGKVRPSLLLPAVLMLPETTTINMAASLEVSPLTKDNYWLRSMWLDCEMGEDGNTRFVPKDFVFSGGVSKQNGYATSDGKPTGNVVFFKLDFAKRVKDIIYAAQNYGSLSNSAGDILIYFRDVLCGYLAFNHEDCYAKTSELMALIAHEFPTKYSGIGDPLPAIMDALKEGVAHGEPASRAHQKIDEPRNLIFFGAPGTGKSYQLNKLGVRNQDNPDGLFPEGNVRRVTFYPDYTYSQFVGSYRPFTESGKISYRYVAGPFLQTYIDASLHPYDNYLLIIEELNRANPASVFGDVFQLLDRNGSGASEYHVSVPAEMSVCIEDALNSLCDAERRSIENYFDPDVDFEGFSHSMRRGLSLPPNMYIWATMNSADQGVFPMDTAFKRRWDFRYIGIDEGEESMPSALDGRKLSEHTVAITGGRAKWNELRKAINVLLLDSGVNEDKLLGPFFLAPEALSDDSYGGKGKSRFMAAFEDKVLLYLYEDAGKMKRGSLFRNGGETFAGVCHEFEQNGIKVFNHKTDKHEGIFANVLDTLNAADALDTSEG